MPFELEEKPPFQDDAELKAYRFSVDVSFDTKNRTCVVTSAGIRDFKLTGPNVFELLDRMPREISDWFHRKFGFEIVVVPTYAMHSPNERGWTDGYVVLTPRAIMAEAERLADQNS